MMSFHRTSASISSSGKPSMVRKVEQGSGTAIADEKSQPPDSMNESIRSLVCCCTATCNVAIFLGAKYGSRSRRYLTCNGGSTFSGMIGSVLPMMPENSDE